MIVKCSLHKSCYPANLPTHVESLFLFLDIELLKIYAFPLPLMYFFNSFFNSSDSFMELIQSFPHIPYYFFHSFFCIPYYFFYRNSLYSFLPHIPYYFFFPPPRTHLILFVFLKSVTILQFLEDAAHVKNKQIR